MHAPDPKAFTAVVKAIFGPSGGGLQCKGVLVELCEGSLTTQTKEVCIQLCKNKTDVVPLAGSETIISRVVELSPRGKPLTKRATLTLPLECATCEESKIFMRWTPSHSGERANWQDVLPSTNPENEEGITLEVTSQKAKIRTKVFGIFCVITTDEIKGVPPTTSHTIKGFVLSSISVLKSFTSGSAMSNELIKSSSSQQQNAKCKSNTSASRKQSEDQRRKSSAAKVPSTTSWDSGPSQSPPAAASGSPPPPPPVLAAPACP